MDLLKSLYAAESRLSSAQVGAIMLILFGVFLSPVRAPSQSTLRPRCTAKSPITLTDTMIGPLAINASLASVRSLCAMAFDTTLSDPASRDKTYPGLTFPFGNATIIALQYGTVTLNTNMPADGWIVVGSVELPGGVLLTADWSQIYKKYPSVQASAGPVLVARLCALPNVLLTLDTDPELVRDASGLVDLSRIPQKARVLQAFVLSKHLGRSLSPC